MTDINYRFIIDVSESVPAELDETLTEGARAAAGGTSERADGFRPGAFR